MVKQKDFSSERKVMEVKWRPAGDCFRDVPQLKLTWGSYNRLRFGSHAWKEGKVLWKGKALISYPVTALDKFLNTSYLCVFGISSHYRPHSAGRSTSLSSKYRFLYNVRYHCGCLVHQSPSSQSWTSSKFLEIHLIKSWFMLTNKKHFYDSNKVLHTADPSLQTKPLLALRLKPIHATFWTLCNKKKTKNKNNKMGYFNGSVTNWHINKLLR